MCCYAVAGKCNVPPCLRRDAVYSNAVVESVVCLHANAETAVHSHAVGESVVCRHAYAGAALCRHAYVVVGV